LTADEGQSLKTSRILPLALAVLPAILVYEAVAFGQLAVSSNFLYVCRNQGNSQLSGLSILDISNPNNPIDTGFNDHRSYSLDVAVGNNYAYVVYGDRWQILNVSNPTNPVNAGKIDGYYWTSVATSGHYAYLAESPTSSSGNLSIYDVSDPGNPVRAGNVTIGNNIGIRNGLGPMVVSGNFVYIAAGYEGLFVCDVSAPANPQIVGHAPTIHGFEFVLDLAVSGNYAYVSAWTNGLWIYDISSPNNPILVSHPYLTASSIALSGNYLYVANGFPPIAVLDISDPVKPTIIGDAQTGAYDDRAGHRLAVSRNYAYLGGGGLSVYSLGTPPPPPLSINPTSTNTLVLSWPTPNPAFAVQQSPALPASNWVTLTNVPMVVASTNEVTIPVPTGTVFYRLLSQ